MTDRYFEKLRAKHPVVHCITNHVTSNDCANLLLACGAVPVMADCPEETAEISSKSSALVINLGTPRLESLAAMLAAGHEAVGLGHPVVFDPVGVGASAFRTDMAASILHDLPLTAIRGNKREITFLAGLASNLTLTANQITNYRVKMPTPAVNSPFPKAMRFCSSTLAPALTAKPSGANSRPNTATKAFPLCGTV